ncbi:helix-turn-helix transcriptional regulator [Methanolobus chelungpuianus]|nr:transcriptional regulator FilR1 domain-containing protein [Methanolobus chelungpuianus]
MKVLLQSMDTTRQALLPQLKILEENYLITRYGDTYELTPISKLIVNEMAPFVETLKVLDSNMDFWGERDLRFIPPELLDRIRELDPYQINEPAISNIHELNRDFTETSASSKCMCAVTNIFHPNFMELFALWTGNKVKITMVISEDLYNKLKTQNRDDFQQLLDNEYIRFKLYSKPFDFVYFALNDRCLLITMLRKDGWYDNKELISFSRSAINWGRNLLEYYEHSSTPITSID